MDIMIDLETMDTASTAAIVAIGAVVFDAKTGTVEKNSAFYTTVDLQSCIDHGMTVAGRTIEWWLTKSEQARTAIIDKPAHIHTALNEFSQWVIRQTDGKPERAHIWGNGADFDNVILTNAYRAVGISRPWEPYHDRCYRTLKNLRRDIHLYRTGTHHNALYDAITQAEHAVRLLQAVHIGHMLQTVRGTDDAATDEINDTQDFDTLPGYIADPSKMVDGEPIPVPEYGETAQDSKE